jgi:hypothetical protein
MAKAELKTKKTAASVAKFIAGIAGEERRRDCETLVKLMEKAAKAKGRMWGTGIVGFGDWRYKYASGREGDWFRIGFSPRKDALTLYLSCGGGWNEKLLAKLGRHKTGKGCLYLKRLADVDMKTLKELIEAAGRGK